MLSKVAKSLWIKTIFALIAGLAISISVSVNLGLITVLPVDVYLITGILVSFFLWALVMVFCLSLSLWQAVKSCLAIFSVSMLINIAASFM